MFIVSFLVRVVIACLPGIMLGFPWWVTTLIVTVLSIFPIPFAAEVFWIAGLIGAINGPQDGWAIAYYVLTVLPVFTTTVNIISFFIDKNKE